MNSVSCRLLENEATGTCSLSKLDLSAGKVLSNLFLRKGRPRRVRLPSRRACVPTSLLTKRIIKPPRLRKGLVKTEFMAPKKDTGKKDKGKLPALGSSSHRRETPSHRGGTPSHRGTTPSHHGNSPSKKEKSSRVNVKKKGKPALDAVSEGALEDGDDTNLDDINDDDDDAVRSTEAMDAQSEQISPQVCTPLPPKLHRALAELDQIVIQVLMRGAIRLLCVKWLLKQPDNFKMPNRQELEALEKSGASPSPLLSREAAAALVRRGDRSIGALTYGWLMSGDPDPAGSRIRVLRRALARLAIEALFWDFGSLYQAPRTAEQKEFFEIALKGGAMNQLYASILATTVLQIEEIPPRPAEFDGVVCLFELKSNADESVVRAALIRFGTIESCDLSRSPAIVRFALHESAVAAKNAGAPPDLCAGLDTLYNETPYFSRGW